jgi:hypothetical protein
MNLKHFIFSLLSGRYLYASLLLHFSWHTPSLIESWKSNWIWYVQSFYCLLSSPSLPPISSRKKCPSPQTPHLSTFSIFLLRILGKTFLGERKQPWVLNIVSIIPPILPYDKNMSLFVALFFSRLSFPLFLSFPLTIFNLLIYYYLFLYLKFFYLHYYAYVKRVFH